MLTTRQSEEIGITVMLFHAMQDLLDTLWKLDIVLVASWQLSKIYYFQMTKIVNV